jgi:catechol 2,3-dioxygenase
MSTSTGIRPDVAIDPRTTLGTVRLTVRDLARSRAFYEGAMGLAPVELDNGDLALRVGAEQHPLIELRGDSSAPALDRRATGLFHLAVLMPSRVELALAMMRLAEAHWPLDGASDHLVSEALYLSDPDGNGVEIYRDRPRDEWRVQDGQLQMATLPLDLRDVLGELAGRDPRAPRAPAGTRMGHVHLQVSELSETEAFYNGVLGFDVMVRAYPGALFVSAGGYHHHIGLNTWHSAGSGPAAPGTVGLRGYEIVLPDAAELEAVLTRINTAGLPTEPDAGTSATLVRDPSGNAIVLTCR